MNTSQAELSALRDAAYADWRFTASVNALIHTSLLEDASAAPSHAAYDECEAMARLRAQNTACFDLLMASLRLAQSPAVSAPSVSSSSVAVAVPLPVAQPRALPTPSTPVPKSQVPSPVPPSANGKSGSPPVENSNPKGATGGADGQGACTVYWGRKAGDRGGLIALEGTYECRSYVHALDVRRAYQALGLYAIIQRELSL